MKLTKEEAVKEFRAHWDWCSWNPAMKKPEYPGLQGKQVLYHCFLCEFTMIGMEQNCSKCPVEWPKTNNRGVYPCTSSYYGDWERAATPEERSRLAALIRDLPEKQDEKPALKVGDWVKVLQPGYNFGSQCAYIDYKPFSHLPWQSSEEGECYEIVAVSEKPNDRYGYVYALKSKENTICYMHNNYVDGEVAPDGLELVPAPAPKFAISDKVVPVSKSAGDSFETWTKHRKKDYVTVQQLPPNKHGNYYVCNSDFFLESDLIPYVELEVKPEPVKKEPKPAFKVGDRVRVNGLIGTVKGVHVETRLTGIEFDVPMGGHNFHGKLDSGYKCQCGYGWYYHAKSIELLPPINQCPEPKTYTESKTFTFKGNKTVCTIEIDGKRFKGVVHCHPTDEWDEELGKQWSELYAQRKMLDTVEKELRRQ